MHGRADPCMLSPNIRVHEVSVMAAYEVLKGAFCISTDSARLDPEAIIAALSQQYWSQGRPRDVITHSLQHSLCFGVYHEQAQIGLARVITDYATFAYLCDVYILDAYRGHGLGKWLIETVTNHPELSGLRRFMLATRDAHGLYAQYGFNPLQAPDRWMEIYRPYTSS